jgi:hypothetical protein
MVGRFEEDKHPRGGKGSQQGGRFVSKGGGGSSVAKPTKRAAKANPTSDAVRQYIDPNSDSHAVKLNQVIRQKGVLTSEQKGVVLAIDKAIDEAPPLSRTVYRGARTVPKGLKADTWVRDLGYMSTSADRDTAVQYAEAEGAGAIYEITPKNGVKALSTAEHDHLQGGAEEEFVLPRGARLLVRSVRKQGNTTIVKADFMEVYLSKEDKAWLTTAGKG